MRLLCIANDVPLPANTGGRVDVWRRMQALHAEGAELALLCWYDVGRSAPPADDLLRTLGTVCEQVKVQPIRRSTGEIFARLLNLWRMPSHAAARWVTTNRSALMPWVEAFRPDAILLDGLYGGAVARWLAQRLGIPMLYRSHNVEHRYMREQYIKERHFVRRLGLLANRVNLGRFERRMLRAAQRVFDISIDDQNFWQSQGYTHVEWLPPLIDDAFARELLESQGASAALDILYFGNLNTPNNVDGVLWLLHEVIGRVREARPGLRIAVAGSRPVARIVAAAGRLGVKLLADPQSMAPLLNSARVVVNPVFAGSGVNVKTVEMLFSPAQLVATSQGLAGLPIEVTRHFHRADAPDAFVKAILKALDAPVDGVDAERADARRHFSFTRAQGLMRSIRNEVERFEKARVSLA